MNSADHSEFSEPASLRALSAEQQERLTAILDRYLSALESGEPLATESLLRENPDLAESLRSYFASLEDLHDIAAGFGRADLAPRSDRQPNEPEDSDERRIGDFRLIREIGRGGMGVVYEAQQISLGRRVALKILPFAAVLDQRQITRFKNEAQAAAQLNHPNIVPVYAIGVERGVHYYAMQFIDGQPLDRAIEELRWLQSPRPAAPAAPPPDAIDTVIEDFAGLPTRVASSRRSLAGDCRDIANVVRLGIDVAEALHAAHESGVIHRDIKPSNLLLDAHGKLWITDFGLARVRSDRSLTRTGDVVGTQRYMSPEQAAGETALVDVRSDVFSLAVTLYELLALRPASEPGRESPVPLRQLRSDVPADLETVLHKAMSPGRDDRYLTAQAFADDLRRVLDGRPTCARPPTPRERLAKWARRHRRVVQSVAAAAAVGVLGLVVAFALIAREKQRAEANFARAEQNFRDAREIVDRFGAQLAERLADVPGAAAARRELLRDTLRYYRQFADQSRDDPKLQAELAMTYGKMASLAEQIGSLDECLAHYELARQACQRLVDDAPAEPRHQRQLAQCLNNYGLALRRADRLAESHRRLDEAIEWQRNLVRQFPADPRHGADLAASQVNLGLLLTDEHRAADAERSFRDAIRLLEPLAAADPRDPAHPHQLAAAYNNLAALFVERQPAESLRLYGQAIQFETAAVAAQPADLPMYSAALALAHNNLAALQSRLGQHAEAVASYERAIEIQSDLVHRDPDQKSVLRDLAVSENNLGLARHRQRDWAAAERSFRRSRELHEQLIARHPDDLSLRSGLGSVWNNFGSLAEDRGQFAIAAEAFREAVVQQRSAFDAAPDVARFRTFLSKHLFNLGRVQRKLGQHDSAVQTALDRRRLWPTSPERLYSVAEELALAGKSAPASSTESASDAIVESTERPSTDAVALSIETLEQAVAAGFVLPRDLATNDTFSRVRSHPRFERLINR